MESSQRIAESTVLVSFTHSHLKAHFPEIRLDKHMTIGSIKQKISTHCGTTPASMILDLRNENGKPLARLAEDHRAFGYYSPYSGCSIHVTDTDPGSLTVTGWLEDTSKVEKYMMSDEEYSRRENTYRKFKEEKLREDPEWTLEKEQCKRRGVPYVAPAKKVTDPDHLKDQAAKLQPGQRCSVDPGERRGEVKYVGPVECLAAGFWVGVQYDEPLGKNDGAAGGKRYFTCPKPYGAFVRPDKVLVGDYPPLDDLDELGSDDEI